MQVENTQSKGNFAICTETIVSEFTVKNTEPKHATEEVAKAYNVSGKSLNLINMIFLNAFCFCFCYNG